MRCTVMKHIEKKYQDDIRLVQRATLKSLDQKLLDKYIELLKDGNQDYLPG